MGCWTHFRRTWRPGYGPDVIDPDKAFDFERRVVLIKKICFIVVLLAVLVGLIFIVLSLTGSNNAKNDPKGDPQSLPHVEPENATTGLQTNVKEENLTTASFFAPGSMRVVTINGMVVAAGGSASPEDNSTVTSASSGSSANDTNITHNSTMTSLNVTGVKPHHQTYNASSGLTCSASGNARECVGLTKSFKTVMTFPNGSNHQTKAEGYVMVRMNNSTWHPYCYPDWTLDMGHNLCRGLGFNKLVKLQIIAISELQQRITRLGRDVFLHPDTGSSSLLVVTTESSALKKGAEFNCYAGLISCD